MAAAHDFSTWPRRGEAAKRLGISVATLRRYEGELIHPIKDKNGEHRFDPQELEALAEKLRKRGVRKAASKQRTDAPRPRVRAGHLTHFGLESGAAACRGRPGA